MELLAISGLRKESSHPRRPFVIHLLQFIVGMHNCILDKVSRESFGLSTSCCTIGTAYEVENWFFLCDSITIRSKVFIELFP